MRQCFRCKNNYMTFPKDEHKEIFKRTNNNLPFYTIRVDKEFNKYYKNQIVDSDLGIKLKIIDFKTINSIKEYQFFEYLSPPQQKYLEKFNKLNIITLGKLYLK